jgi:hypothetical protein
MQSAVMLHSLTEEAGLTQNQAEWLSRPAHTSEIEFMVKVWGEEFRYEPERSNIALQIAIDAWRLGFLDTWNEDIIDHVLVEKLPAEDRPYIEAYKQQLQMEMRFEEDAEPNETPFRKFLKANLACLPNGFPLEHIVPMDGEIIFNSTDRSIYIFRKGWPSGSLVFLRTYEGEDIPASAKMVISDD